MRTLAGSVVVVALVLVLTSTVWGHLGIAGQVGLGSVTYDNLLTLSDKAVISEWTTLLEGTFTAADDLLVHVAHATSTGRTLKVGADPEQDLGREDSSNRSFTQGAVMIDLLRQDGLMVHGGLGYKFSSAQFKHMDIARRIANPAEAERLRLRGHGFIGQVNVDIDVMEALRLHAAISGTPWYNWSYSRGNITEELSQRGSSYHYQLGVEYSLSADWGVRAGYSGGSLRVPGFNFNNNPNDPVLETNGAYAGLTAGVTISF